METYTYTLSQTATRPMASVVCITCCILSSIIGLFISVKKCMKRPIVGERMTKCMQRPIIDERLINE